MFSIFKIFKLTPRRAFVGSILTTGTTICIHEQLCVKEGQLEKLWFSDSCKFYLRLDDSHIMSNLIHYQKNKMWIVLIKNDINNIHNVPMEIATADFFVSLVENNVIGKNKLNSYLDRCDYKDLQGYWDLLYKKGLVEAHNVSYNYRTCDQWILAIGRDCCRICDVPEKFRNQNFFNEIVKTNPKIWEDIPDKFRSLELWRFLYKRGYTKISDIPITYRTQDVYNELIATDPKLLKKFPKEFITLDMCLKIDPKSNVIGHIPVEFLPEYLYGLPRDFFIKENLKYFDGIRVTSTIFNDLFKDIAETYFVVKV